MRRVPHHDQSSTVLDDDHAAFVQSGLSIVVASRSEDNVPSVARALGCRVAEDRGSVTIFLWAPQAGALLTDIRATGMVAVVFSRPSTHRTIQLKGRDARVVPRDEGGRAIVARNTDLLVQDLAWLGHRQDLARAYLHCEPDELAAIVFTPSAGFDQTPGPGAGKPLGSR